MLREGPVVNLPCDRRGGTSPLPSGHYGYFTLSVGEAIELAANGTWQLADFQRSFVWKPIQVSALADSLWHGYPIGALLLWTNCFGSEDSSRVPGGLIADGLHRLTSLCLLFDRTPCWLKPEPEVVQRFTVYFDVEAEDGPKFVTSDQQGPRRSGLIPLKSILTLNPKQDCYKDRLCEIAAELRERGCGTRLELKAISDRVRRVVEIRHRQLLVTALYFDRDQVIEIFQRLNSRGMKFRRLLLKFAMQGMSGGRRGGMPGRDSRRSR